MMLLHKLRQLARAVKWRKQVAQVVSTQLMLLEDPDAGVLGRASIHSGGVAEAPASQM